MNDWPTKPVTKPRKARKKFDAEAVVEDDFCERVKALGGMAPKFTSPARRSVPDRLRLLPIAPEHRAIVARYFGFVELKAEGKEPTAAQLREHTKLRGLGYQVDVVDTRREAKAWAPPAQQGSVDDLF